MDRVWRRFAVLASRAARGYVFAEVLTQDSILQVLDEHQVEYRAPGEQARSTTITRASLARCSATTTAAATPSPRVLAHRASSGLEPCSSPNAASYCNARARLPTGVLRAPTAKRTARQLQDGLPQAWQWHGRGAYIADGSHVSAPDHPAGTRRPTRRSTNAEAGPRLSRWPEWPCCYRWRRAPATTWPSRRTQARAPARPRCCGSCTTSLQPGRRGSSPTPCSTTTSSPASCTAAASSWWPAWRRSRVGTWAVIGERARRRPHPLAAAPASRRTA